MYGYFLPVRYVCVPFVCPMLEEAKKDHQKRSELTDDCELAAMWVLGIEPRSFAKAASVLNCCDISLSIYYSATYI